MNEYVYRYRFRQGARMREVEETLLLSIFAAEGLHGEARVHMDVTYCISQEKRGLVIDAGTPAGQTVSSIFTALAMKEYGEDSFTVDRIRRKREKEQTEEGGTREV